jgi:hypothetical protein
MSNYKISEVMNGKSPKFSLSMSVDQVKACNYAIQSHDALAARVAELEGALNYVLYMQTRGFVVLGDEFTNIANKALEEFTNEQL